MSIIQQVFDLSKVILYTKPYHVSINNSKVDELAEQMKKDGCPNFSEPEQKYKTGIMLEILKEIVASSINYCYWYGYHDIRPNGVSSTSMYNDVNECFDGAIDHELNFEGRIHKLIDLLSIHRYPLLEERKRHLLDLCEGRKAEHFAIEILHEHDRKDTMLFNELVKDKEF